MPDYLKTKCDYCGYYGGAHNVRCSEPTETASYIKNVLFYRDKVLMAIDHEPEYPDADEWVDEVKTAIMEFPSVDEHVASALADMVISCARISVRETKKGITERVLKI